MTYKQYFFKQQQDGLTVEACITRVGKDYLLTIWGGEAHIGAVAMAQPRPSLQVPGRLSATASVFCYLGHKEDELVKRAAERLAGELDAKVVVAAGLHWEQLSPTRTRVVLDIIDLLVTEIIREMKLAGK